MKKLFLPITLSLLLFCSCTSIGTFEKNIVIPGHAWSSDFKPEIKLEITDTVSKHNMYVVLRHTNAYRYNNIWINIYTQVPGNSNSNKQRFDLRLATDDKGWLGSGMDDIYEHRILIAPVRFPRTGTYTFRFENIMRDNPLEHVMNIGLRVERATE